MGVAIPQPVTVLVAQCYHVVAPLHYGAVLHHLQLYVVFLRVQLKAVIIYLYLVGVVHRVVISVVFIKVERLIGGLRHVYPYDIAVDVAPEPRIVVYL